MQVLAQQESDRSKDRPSAFGSPHKSPSSKQHSRDPDDKSKALKMRLATSTSHVLT